jgi:hypothetical protein
MRSPPGTPSNATPASSTVASVPHLRVRGPSFVDHIDNDGLDGVVGQEIDRVLMNYALHTVI